MDLLVSIQDRRRRGVFMFLLKAIVGLNVDDGDGSLWLDGVKKDIKAHSGLRDDELKRAILPLYKLKTMHGTQTSDYLSAIVPKYVLRNLEWDFGANGANDVYVYIEKTLSGGKYVWDSSQRQGSNSVDAAVWNSLSQKGACYECKLGTSIKQDQIDLLSCIWHESKQKIEVGLASFASDPSMKKQMAEFSIPRFVRVITRDDIFSYWSF